MNAVQGTFPLELILILALYKSLSAAKFFEFLNKLLKDFM
jgi:hypothetical protein